MATIWGGLPNPLIAGEAEFASGAMPLSARILPSRVDL